MVEENSRNSLLTLLIKTPLLIGSISTQFSGENSSKRMGKTGSKSLQNLIEKQCPNPQIYRLRKTSRWGLSGLAVDRQRSKIRPLEPPVDRKEQRALLSVSVDRPIDRPDTREHCSLVRSTGPLSCQTCTALCTSVDRAVDRPLVWSTVRSTDLACQPVLGQHLGEKLLENILLNLVFSKTCFFKTLPNTKTRYF